MLGDGVEASSSSALETLPSPPPPPPVTEEEGQQQPQSPPALLPLPPPTAQLPAPSPRTLPPLSPLKAATGSHCNDNGSGKPPLAPLPASAISRSRSHSRSNTSASPSFTSAPDLSTRTNHDEQDSGKPGKGTAESSCRNGVSRSASGVPTRGTLVSLASLPSASSTTPATGPPSPNLHSGGGGCCSGWLYKKAKVVKSWKRRWFLLLEHYGKKGPVLHYYLHPPQLTNASPRAQGEIVLTGCSIGIEDADSQAAGQGLGFVLTTLSGRHFHLRAESRSEAERWIFSLKRFSADASPPSTTSIAILQDSPAVATASDASLSEHSSSVIHSPSSNHLNGSPPSSLASSSASLVSPTPSSCFIPSPSTPSSSSVTAKPFPMAGDGGSSLPSSFSSGAKLLRNADSSPSKKKEKRKSFHGTSTSSIMKTVASVKNKVYKQRIPMFGVRLEELVVKEGRTDIGMPVIIEKTTAYLEARAPTTHGLFRMSGSAERVRTLKAAFEKHGADVDLGKYDPHCIAGVLTLYIRELPEPLMTYDLYDEFKRSQINLSDESETSEETLQALKSLLQRMPYPNLCVLKRIMAMCLTVSHHSSINDMTIKNLAIVWTPNLFRPRNDNILQSMKDAPYMLSVTKELLDHYSLLFLSEKEREDNPLPPPPPPPPPLLQVEEAAEAFRQQQNELEEKKRAQMAKLNQRLDNIAAVKGRKKHHFSLPSLDSERMQSLIAMYREMKLSEEECVLLAKLHCFLEYKSRRRRPPSQDASSSASVTAAATTSSKATKQRRSGGALIEICTNTSKKAKEAKKRISGGGGAGSGSAISLITATRKSGGSHVESLPTTDDRGGAIRIRKPQHHQHHNKETSSPPSTAAAASSPSSDEASVEGEEPTAGTLDALLEEEEEMLLIEANLFLQNSLNSIISMATTTRQIHHNETTS
ncbi:Unconventional myosin-IXb [Balamuthia mandrillaris]